MYHGLIAAHEPTGIQLITQAGRRVPPMWRHLWRSAVKWQIPSVPPSYRLTDWNHLWAPVTDWCHQMIGFWCSSGLLAVGSDSLRPSLKFPRPTSSSIAFAPGSLSSILVTAYRYRTPRFDVIITLYMHRKMPGGICILDHRPSISLNSSPKPCLELQSLPW